MRQDDDGLCLFTQVPFKLPVRYPGLPSDNTFGLYTVLQHVQYTLKETRFSRPDCQVTRSVNGQEHPGSYFEVEILVSICSLDSVGLTLVRDVSSSSGIQDGYFEEKESWWKIGVNQEYPCRSGEGGRDLIANSLSTSSPFCCLWPSRASPLITSHHSHSLPILEHARVAAPPPQSQSRPQRHQAVP